MGIPGIDAAPRLERDGKNAVRAYLRKLRPHGKFSKIPQGMYSEAGVSDILGTYKKASVALETKSATGRPTRLQLKFLREHKAAGGVGGVIRTVREAMDIIESIDAELSGKD